MKKEGPKLLDASLQLEGTRIAGNVLAKLGIGRHHAARAVGLFEDKKEKRGVPQKSSGILSPDIQTRSALIIEIQSLLDTVLPDDIQTQRQWLTAKLPHLHGASAKEYISSGDMKKLFAVYALLGKITGAFDYDI